MFYLDYLQALVDSLIPEVQVAEAAFHLSDKAERSHKLDMDRTNKHSKNYKHPYKLAEYDPDNRVFKKGNKERGVHIGNSLVW